MSIVSSVVVAIMVAPAFHQAWLVVGLVGAAYALKGCYLIIVPGIYFVKKLYWLSIIEWVAAIANIALNLILMFL